MRIRLLPARKKKLLYSLLLAACCPAAFTVAQRVAPPLSPTAATYSNKLTAAPLLFTENRGQVTDVNGSLRPDILFTAHSSGAKVFLTATGIHYQFTKTVFPQQFKLANGLATDPQKEAALRRAEKTETYRFTLSLQGSAPAPTVRKEEPNAYTENFYLAGCPAGITNVHTYSRLVYENVYPGIDWVIYTPPVTGGSAAAGLKYDFIVRPGADPNLIQLKASNAQRVLIDKEEALVMTTTLGEVKEAAPTSYCGGTTVNTAFVQRANGTIGFATGAYDKNEILVIDPSVTWATYYGGSGDDDGRSCAVDGSGNVYLAGRTTSTTGIASGGFQNGYGGGSFNTQGEAFLVKFSNSGSRLWATYYGGSGAEYGIACAVDGSGNVYLAGSTSTTSGMASGGFQNTFGGNGGLSYKGDAFLAKFNSSGGRLWATYYGGEWDDIGFSCTVDGNGSVYLAGYTESSTNIAFGGFQNTFGGGGGDPFLVKFSSSGSRQWATYYGGNSPGYEFGYGCATDGSNNVYLTGYTSSASGIASGGFQNTPGSGDNDAFLVKFSGSGSRLWATYYGGFYADGGYACAVDGSDNVYMAGFARSDGLASGGFQNTRGGEADVFLVKFSSNGNRLWATYYGGGGIDVGRSCAVDGNGNVYLAGDTESDTGIAFGGFQNTYGGNNGTSFKGDAFLAKFDGSGSRLWASYYGGYGTDNVVACAVDGIGHVYLAGFTNSSSGIASGGFQNTFNSGYSDAFLAKIDGSTLQSFTSIANGNWNDPSIWLGGVVPGAGSVVIVNTAVTVTADASCYSVTVNLPGSITVSSGVTLTVLH